MKKQKPRYGFMCLTDYLWEVGEALGGNTVFPDLKDLKKHRKCVKSCGVARVKIVLDEIVRDRKPFRGKNVNLPKKDAGRKLAARLKDLGEQPPGDIADKINGSKPSRSSK